MAEPGTFVTTWKDDLGERWNGYFEPARICWREAVAKREAVSSKPVQSSQAPQTKIENIDVNIDGYVDRFELVEEANRYQIRLFRGAQTESSLGCAGHYTIFREVGFEKEGLVVQTIAKDRVLITGLAWISGRLVVSGVEVWGKVPSKDVRWEIVFETCPPPPEKYQFPRGGFFSNCP